MGRPRKEEGQKAVALLEQTFFQQLASTPFEKLTISGIAKTAGVNRNSFYYHYADINDLALSAVNGLLLSDIPKLVSSGLGPTSKELSALIIGAVRDGNFRRMTTIIGPNSTAELRGMLKQAVYELWLAAFHLEPADLNPQEDATMSFALAGALELASMAGAHLSHEAAEEQELLQAITSTTRLPILQLCSEMMTEALAAAASRKAAKLDDADT